MNNVRDDIQILIVKIAERCNLNCSYCYMYNHADRSYIDRPVFMSGDIFRALLTRVRDYCLRRPGHTIRIVFHGGEPMLVGPRVFDEFASAATDYLGSSLAGLAVQTNATLITDEWVKVLRRHRVAIGVSLDGPPETHNQVRVDFAGKGSHERVINGLSILQKAGLHCGILCVVNPGRSGYEAYRYFRSLDVANIDFLFPDASHDSKPLTYAAYGETPISDFLIPIFDAWFYEDDPNVKIRVFIDIIRSLLGGKPISEVIGNSISGYLVIDTDGSIQTNDALRVCDTGIAESGLNVVDNGFDELYLGHSMFRSIVLEGMPLAQKCRVCPELNICSGGFLPHRYSRKNGFDNPSIWCDDLLTLISHIRHHVDLSIGS
jgi:uncharacterized protein